MKRGESETLRVRASERPLMRPCRSGWESDEAFGLHLGDPQLADLGDGKGPQKQTRELRHNYGEVILGTLTETLIGGNHLRYWKQEGSNAYFLAASAEKNVQEHHDIVPDGYDLGRDQLVGKLVGYDLKGKPKAGDTYKGESHALGWTYETSVEYVDGLLAVDQGEYRFRVVSRLGQRYVPAGMLAALANNSHDQPPRHRLRRRQDDRRPRRPPHRAHQKAWHLLSIYYNDVMTHATNHGPFSLLILRPALAALVRREGAILEERGHEPVLVHDVAA